MTSFERLQRRMTGIIDRRLSGAYTNDTDSKSLKDSERKHLNSKSPKSLKGTLEPKKSNNILTPSKSSNQMEMSRKFEKQACNVIRFSKAGEILLIGKIDGTLCIWKFEGNRLETRYPLHKQYIYMIEFTDNERQIITAGFDGYIKISLIFGRFQELRSINNQGPIIAGLFCQYENLLICNGRSPAELNVWNLTQVLEECRNKVDHSRNIVIHETSKDPMDSKDLVSGKRPKSVSEKPKNTQRVVKISFKMLNENARKMKSLQEKDKGINYKNLYFEMVKENQYFKEKMKEYKQEIRKVRKFNKELLNAKKQEKD